MVPPKYPLQAPFLMPQSNGELWRNPRSRPSAGGRNGPDLLPAFRKAHLHPVRSPYDLWLRVLISNGQLLSGTAISCECLRRSFENANRFFSPQAQQLLRRLGESIRKNTGRLKTPYSVSTVQAETRRARAPSFDSHWFWSGIPQPTAAGRKIIASLPSGNAPRSRW
jgi:hypothetical protein